ncbi:MAG: hypothetical protein RIS70_919, partial [Planctomycetota bacterium]
MTERATTFRLDLSRPDQHRTFLWARRLAILLTTLLPASRLVAEPIEFNRDVRPLLSEYCFACHGPDKNQRKADLRLDTREGLLGTADAPGSVKSGDPDASELMRRITVQDDDEVMPPPSTGKKLSAGEIRTLRQWIAEGAKWEGHWSFQPVRSVDSAKLTAPVKAVTAATDPIDRFVLTSLQQHGLAMSAQADPVTLARRLSLDLRGLPPDPEDVQRF